MDCDIGQGVELNISLVLEVRGDSVKCTGFKSSSPVAAWQAMESTPQSNDSHRKETSGTNGVPPCAFSCACFGERAGSRRGTTRREEGRADRYHSRQPNTGSLRPARNSPTFGVQFAPLGNIPGSSSSTRNRSNWETGCIVGVRSAGGIIGLAEVSEPPRIQPEPKEQLLFIRNSEKFRETAFA